MTNSQRLAWAFHVKPLRNLAVMLEWGSISNSTEKFSEMPKEIQDHILEAERKFGKNPNIKEGV